MFSPPRYDKNKRDRWNVTLEGKLQHYNDGGTIGPKGRAYAKEIINARDNLTSFDSGKCYHGYAWIALQASWPVER